MKAELKEVPKKGAIIIDGFTSFGLVGTIASEYLIDHLGAKQIGQLTSEKIPAIVAIHEGKVIEPFAIFYDEKNNIVILRAIATVKGMEWELADATLQLSKNIGAKEIVSIEGVGGTPINAKNPKAFYFTASQQKKKKFDEMGLEQLKEGIIVGVTASLLSKLKEGTFIFAESSADLPDSRAAAKIIEILDKYLGLDIDYKPLVEKAKNFEQKIKGLLERGTAATKETEEKQDNYFG